MNVYNLLGECKFLREKNTEDGGRGIERKEEGEGDDIHIMEEWVDGEEA